VSTPYHILIGGIFSLVGLVIGSVLDFFKREPRYRYDIYSRADTFRMFYLFLGLTALGWSIVVLMQLNALPPVIGWPAFLVLFAVRMVMVEKDFSRRRLDVPNLMLRLAQYEFVIVACALVLISYEIHKNPPATRPSPVPIRLAS
jgi:hypothetical protein